LAFTPKSLEVQRSVVIEEFKQRYLNQPYGDVWLTFRPLIYKNHPYKWATIGKNIEQIEKATMEDVKEFFFTHYGPQNATLVVGGNVSFDEVKRLSKKYFEDIPARPKPARDIPPEPAQNEARSLDVERQVPSDAVYLAFRMGARMSDEHYTGDLISDILGRGKSSRLNSELVDKRKLFTSISAYITASWEDGLFVVSGNLMEGVSIEEGENGVWEVLEAISKEKIQERELVKVKNKFKTAKVFSEQSLMNRVMNIAMFDMMGKLDDINNELKHYDDVSADSINEFCTSRLVKTNCSTLRIKAIK
jgi:zinc protease